MPANRRLPQDSRYPPIATDWTTGQTEHTEVVFRQGKWWDRWTWEHHSRGRWRSYDRRKRDRNLSLKTFLSVQTADPGL